VANKFVYAVHHFPVPNFDGEFPPAVEAPGRQIDGTDDGSRAVSEQELGMQFEVVDLVDFHANII